MMLCRWALLWLCVPVIALSAFVNNTPIVAALVPLVQVLIDVIYVCPII